MTFCKALEKALEEAPSEEAAAAVQAVIDEHCGGVVAQGGGTGNGPPED